MRTQTSVLCALALGLVGACADDGASEDTGQLKQAASRAYASGDATARPRKDLCEVHGWYDDGVCDAWCPTRDPGDCADASGNDGEPDDGDVACTLIWRPADGKCDLSDPCAKVQDEDCQAPRDGGSEPIACAAIAYETNGKCEAPAGCEQNDPVDCQVGGIACIEIAYGTNGKCEAAKGCEYTDPVDCQKGPPACTKIRYPDDGKCEAAKGCEASDPVDCQPEGVVCIAIAYETNGKCEAPKGCEQNDAIDCKPLICPAIYIPEDGVCPPNTPCDPDCLSQSVSNP